MKTYHTYNAVDIAFCLINHAARTSKGFTNLKLQHLTYVCHGWSLALYKRPLIIEDVLASQQGPMIVSIYFRFKQFDSRVINEKKEIELDGESEQIISDIASLLGDFSEPELVELTRRAGSPWQQVWDGERKARIPDDLIEEHYSQINCSSHATCL